MELSDSTTRTWLLVSKTGGWQKTFRNTHHHLDGTPCDALQAAEALYHSLPDCQWTAASTSGPDLDPTPDWSYYTVTEQRSGWRLNIDGRTPQGLFSDTSQAVGYALQRCAGKPVALVRLLHRDGSLRRVVLGFMGRRPY